MHTLNKARFALFVAIASATASASEKVSILLDPGAAIDKKFAEIDRRLTELEKGQITQVAEKTLKLGINPNASSWIINPHIYQERWIIRVFNMDMIAKGEGKQGGAIAGLETGLRQADVDFIICTPAIDGDHIIVKGYKKKKA